MKFLQQNLSSTEPRSNDGFTRRSILIAGGGAAGLLIGASLSGCSGGNETLLGATGSTKLVMNPFVHISTDGTVTVLCKHLDKGQGTLTGLASIVADELDASWEQVAGDFAPSDPEVYGNIDFGPFQGTGGSNGISNSYMQYRNAGATARAMLVQAAANKWNVPTEEVTISDGTLRHSSGKFGGFGEFAEAASQLPVPTNVALKPPTSFKFIGKTGHGRLDSEPKSRGASIFTQDVDLPGMLVAVVARPPKFGALVASYDDSAARAIDGVEDVVQIPQGIAVLAKNTWVALKGREALSIDWDESQAETRSSDQLLNEYLALAEEPGVVAKDEGDTESALATAAQIVEATFEFPYLAHAPMEPMNAVANLIPGQSLDIWTGSQMQTLDHGIAAEIAGLNLEAIKIHTIYAGGSFGRRANPVSDFVAEAVSIAVVIDGRAPVKLVWTREDDIRGGYYRPMYVHKIRGGLDAHGNITGIEHRIVGQSIVSGGPFAGMITAEGIDPTTIEGAAELPYAVGAHKVEVHTTEVGVPVLWWRAVGSTHNAYVIETMMDRLASAAGVDPLEFRLRNMQKHPREAEVLRRAAEAAGWGQTELADNTYRGLAVHKSFNSYVAQVAEVQLNDDGTLSKVKRVVCAVDCGVAVMPDQVKAQMEGGIGYGLGAALRNKITLTEGVVDQSQFFDYQPLRMSDMPAIETVIIDSSERPTGTGEPGLPPIAPAIANAIFNGTKREVNSLPFSDHGLV